MPLFVAGPAFAHPHVWVTAKEEVILAQDGKFSAIRHIWTFDKHFTSYSTEGLDKNRDGKLAPEELKELAKQNVESLVLFDYYTALKVNGVTVTFDAPRDYRMLVADGQATLTFVLPAKAPAAAKVLALEIADPSGSLAFTLADGDDAMKLVGSSKGCAVSITRAKPMEVAKQQQNLSESFFQALTSQSSSGTPFANKAIIACP